MKEMASMLFSSLCFPADDVVSGFVMLIELADDTTQDNPIVLEDLALHLEEIGTQCLGLDSIGSKVL